MTLLVDGKPIEAAKGEPVALALAVSGRTVLSRSVKYHRPRGAHCYAGHCDGCLMRVNGTPSVATCCTPAEEGMRVETQNVVGSAERDLLSVTDWFFPSGMDHHHMFTRFRPINEAMQKVARRVAGIGRLPDEVRTAATHEELATDVLVVGAGVSGVATALVALEAGRSVTLVEQGEALFGTLRFALHEDLEDTFDEWRSALRGFEDAGRLRVLLGHVAAGVYREPTDRHEADAPGVTVAVSGADALLRVQARHLVIATGLVESAHAVPGGDLPGVLGLRAAAKVLHHGVLPGEKVVLAAGQGSFAQVVQETLVERGAEVLAAVHPSQLVNIEAKGAVRRVTWRDEAGERRVDADCVIVRGPESVAYELAAQAGAKVRFFEEGEAYGFCMASGGGPNGPLIVGSAARAHVAIPHTLDDQLEGMTIAAARVEAEDIVAEMAAREGREEGESHGG